MDSVGNRMRKIREMRGWTQKYVAERAGLHVVSYQYYELGTRNAKPDTLQRIADALEVDIAFLYPTKTNSPMSLLALLFDLLEDYGDVKMENRGGTVLFGIDNMKHPMENFKLQDAVQAHNKMTSAEFKEWLINYPPKVHNGKIEK